MVLLIIATRGPPLSWNAEIAPRKQRRTEGREVFRRDPAFHDVADFSRRVCHLCTVTPRFAPAPEIGEGAQIVAERTPGIASRRCSSS